MRLGAKPSFARFQLESVTKPQHDGTVRLFALIQYGGGQGVRYLDLTIAEAEALGVELIQAAQIAHTNVERAATTVGSAKAQDTIEVVSP